VEARQCALSLEREREMLDWMRDGGVSNFKCLRLSQPFSARLPCSLTPASSPPPGMEASYKFGPYEIDAREVFHATPLLRHGQPPPSPTPCHDPKRLKLALENVVSVKLE
jgi:hypothetical protein